MSIVRAARDDTPASHLPSPAVAVPQPRRPEPASPSLAAPSCAARTVSAGASAAPRPARPATPSRHHVRAVLTGALRNPRSAPRLRIVRPSDQPAAIPAPCRHPPRRPSASQPCAACPRQLASPAPARLADSRSAPAPSPSTGLRLTRRGRLVLSVFALALILGLIAILWASLAGGAQAASGRARTGSVYQGLRRVTVLPGQTLWAIAQQAEPSADPRTVIPQIMQINAISSTNLQPGQQLWVPRSLIPASSPSPPLPSAGPAPASAAGPSSAPAASLSEPPRLAAISSRWLGRRAGRWPGPRWPGSILSLTRAAIRSAGRHRRRRPPARELCLPRRDTPPELASGPALDHNI